MVLAQARKLQILEAGQGVAPVAVRTLVPVVTLTPALAAEVAQDLGRMADQVVDPAAARVAGAAAVISTRRCTPTIIAFMPPRIHQLLLPVWKRQETLPLLAFLFGQIFT